MVWFDSNESTFALYLNLIKNKDYAMLKIFLYYSELLQVLLMWTVCTQYIINGQSSVKLNPELFFGPQQNL